MLHRQLIMAASTMLILSPIAGMPYSRETVVAQAIIDAASPMQSTAGAADVLVALAENEAITTPELGARYLRVADALDSKEDSKRARDALSGG